MASTGNATDFGDLTAATQGSGGIDNGSRAVAMGGYRGGYDVTIDYITIASTGNATDFGDLDAGRHHPNNVNDTTRGVVSGGQSTGAAIVNSIEYITTATLGNGTDFGDMTAARYGSTGGCDQST